MPSGFGDILRFVTELQNFSEINFFISDNEALLEVKETFTSFTVPSERHSCILKRVDAQVEINKFVNFAHKMHFLCVIIKCN